MDFQSTYTVENVKSFVENVLENLRYDVNISIKGKHHIVDGFMSEIYGVSHYSFFDDEIKRSPLYVPTVLSPSNEYGDEVVFVGDDAYDTFGFEPYLCIDNNNLFHREGIYENYEVSLVGSVGPAWKKDDPVTICYAPEVNSMLTLYPDGSVEFSFGYSDRVVLRFAENGVFAAYNGNDASRLGDGSYSSPMPLYVHTHGISVKLISNGKISGNFGEHTHDTGNIHDADNIFTADDEELNGIDNENNDADTADDSEKVHLDGYLITLCYTIRTPGGVCEEANVEFEIKPIENNKRGEKHEN